MPLTPLNRRVIVHDTKNLGLLKSLTSASKLKLPELIERVVASQSYPQTASTDM